MAKKEIIKVLNSETKMSILLELSKGQKTPTDLSKKLGKVKSTIVEHLEDLERLGLVSKSEMEGRKWVFYSLSKDGYRLLEGRPKIYEIVLPASIITLLFGFVMLINKPEQKMRVLAETQAYQSANTIPLVFIFVGIAGLIFYFFKVKKNG